MGWKRSMHYPDWKDVLRYSSAAAAEQYVAVVRPYGRRCQQLAAGWVQKLKLHHPARRRLALSIFSGTVALWLFLGVLIGDWASADDRIEIRHTTTLLSRSTSIGPTCDDLLQIPKMAMLFLTPGKLPHERLWREWMDGATGLLPTQYVRHYAQGWMGLDSVKLREIQDACLPQYLDRQRPLLERQYLFTVYVHTHPAFRGYRKFSLFAGRIIPNRVVGKRGYHSLTDAERLLLAEALKDPLNQRFYLISETTVPLYPAAFTWQQAMAENVSRVDACNYKEDKKGNLERWNQKMETEHFKKHHWRKTSQWFSLIPSHAQLILEDVEINEAFEKYCFPYHDHILQRNVSCSSNEHYIAIVLAVHGLAHETTCWGGGNTHVDWTRMNLEGRPRSWRRDEITEAVVRHARASMCNERAIQRALRVSARRFVSVVALPVRKIWPQIYVPRYPAISANCSLFMRKFSTEVAVTVRENFRKYIVWPPRLS